MKSDVARRLIRLNAQFYERFAGPFAESRAHIQPGIRRALAQVLDCRSILDAGCGDGRVAQALTGMGWAGDYVGLDASPALLTRATARDLKPMSAVFVQADLAESEWPERLPRRRYDAALALAVLHHVPGRPRRRRLVQQLANRVRPGGRLVISTWQFLDDDRLRRKLVPWESIGLTAETVDPGDHLIDWKRSGEGLRYVCAVDEAEMRRLGQAARCEVCETYRADGRSRELSLYAILACP
jgi:SAM-dependent methyltransferase